MSKPKPDMSAIQNELKGGSVFFRRPEPQSSKTSAPEQKPEHPKPADADNANGRTPERANARTGERANTRTTERPNGRSGERVIKRQSYNVYEDQHRQQQRLEASRALSGTPVPISVMVRQALDDYLSKQG